MLRSKDIAALAAEPVVPGFWSCTTSKNCQRTQANLAALYQAGRGVHRDLVQAYKWYQLSQKNGRTDWSHQLRELANMMTSDEIAEAERMASEWRPHKESSAEGESNLLE